MYLECSRTAHTLSIVAVENEHGAGDLSKTFIPTIDDSLRTRYPGCSRCTILLHGSTRLLLILLQTLKPDANTTANQTHATAIIVVTKSSLLWVVILTTTLWSAVAYLRCLTVVDCTLDSVMNGTLSE